MKWLTAFSYVIIRYGQEKACKIDDPVYR